MADKIVFRSLKLQQTSLGVIFYHSKLLLSSFHHLLLSNHPWMIKYFWSYTIYQPNVDLFTLVVIIESATPSRWPVTIQGCVKQIRVLFSLYPWRTTNNKISIPHCTKTTFDNAHGQLAIWSSFKIFSIANFHKIK